MRGSNRHEHPLTLANAPNHGVNESEEEESSYELIVQREDSNIKLDTVARIDDFIQIDFVLRNISDLPWPDTVELVPFDDPPNLLKFHSITDVSNLRAHHTIRCRTELEAINYGETMLEWELIDKADKNWEQEFKIEAVVRVAEGPSTKEYSPMNRG